MDLSRKLGIDEVHVQGKRVLVRVDYNVPLNGDGSIADNQRIVASLPTIKYLLAHGARSIVLISHLGRPDGVRNDRLSLGVARDELARLLSRPVTFLPDCVGAEVEQACREAKDGEVILLENLRFHVEEEGKVTRSDGTKAVATPEQVAAFRRSLSSLGDLFVQDAFGTVHRPHSSIVGVEMSVRAAGLLVKKELAFFARALEGPEKMDLAIIGGAKVSDKLPLILHMLKRVRNIAVGGAMPFTFLKAAGAQLFPGVLAAGMSIGKSLFDPAGALQVSQILEEAAKEGVKIHLPVDFITGSAFSADAEVGYATLQSGIPETYMGLDIGPRSIQLFKDAILSARSILWNGPVGAFELAPFSAGTEMVLGALVEATATGAMTIVGGGDSAAAVAKWGKEHELSHVSTGGGASLELLEGKELPGIKVLSEKSEGGEGGESGE